MNGETVTAILFFFVGIIAAVFFTGHYFGVINSASSASLLAKLRNYRFAHPGWDKFLLTILTGALLLNTLIMFARPHGELEDAKYNEPDNQVFFLVDTSTSMNVDDLYPYSSRLDAVKGFLEVFKDAFPQFKFALASFNTTLNLELPPTTDMDTFTNVSQSLLSLPYKQNYGTGIYDALLDSREQLLAPAFTNDSNPEAQTWVVILSDGGDTGAQKDLSALSTYFTEHNCKVIILGFGSDQGSKVNASEDDNSYVTDDNGNHITSKLNREVISNVASQLKAQKYFVTNMSSLDDSIRSIQANTVVDTTSQNAGAIQVYQEHYPVYALVELALILILTFNLFRSTRFIES